MITVQFLVTSLVVVPISASGVAAAFAGLGVNLALSDR